MAKNLLSETLHVDRAAARCRAAATPPTANGGGIRLRACIACGVASAALVAGCESGSRPPGIPDGTVPIATFAKSYGDERFNTALSAIATSDGGYAFVGHWGGYDDELDQPNATVRHDYSLAQHHDVWIVKLDGNGDLVWQRNIGERIGSEGYPRVPEQVGRRLAQTTPLRRTLDGGFIVAGVEKTAEEIGDSGHVRFAARKYDANGSLEWEHSYASGAWLDYEFIPESWDDNTLEARDFLAQDVWPAADGTYWVVGASIASVRSSRNPPFDGDDEYSVRPVGHEAHNAQSTVVLRLDAEGQLIGLHRFTDGQFREVWHPKDANPAIIRADAQGRGILVRRLSLILGGESRPNRSVAIVDRLGVDARPIDRYVLDVEVHDDGDPIPPPVDVIQTDDLEGLPIPSRDGVADDGYLVLFGGTAERSAAHQRIVKLSEGLEPTWIRENSPTRRFPDFALAQACVPAPLIRFGCNYVVGGQIGDDMPIGILTLFDDAGVPRDFVWEHGVERVEALTFDAANGEIVAIGGRGSQGLRFRTTPALAHIPGSQTAFERPADDGLHAHFELDGGFIIGRNVYDANAQPVDLLHSSLQPTTEDSEDVVGLVEVGPDSFVLAANTSTFSDVSVPGREYYAKQVWLMRVTSGRIDWQQLYNVDQQRETMARAIAPTSDGGFVLNVHTRDLSCAPGTACVYPNHQVNARLVKFAPDGRIEWESLVIDRFPVARHAAAGRDSLRAVGDGFLVVTGHGKLTRVSAAGAIVWQRELGNEPLDGAPRDRLDIRSMDGFDADTDGARDGYVVLGDYGGALEVATLDADGDVLWSRALRTVGGAELNFRADRTLIRSTPDGGFVVAGDDSGFVQRPVDDGGTPRHVAVGRRNVLVLKLDRAAAVHWYRAYGGAYDEVVGDLDVLDDGGFLIAGGSDSMGSRRDAWILRLDADGRIADGCHAELAAHKFRMAGPLDDTDLSSLSLEGSGPGLDPPPGALRHTTSAARGEPIDIARQCSGVAYPSPGTPVTRFRLTIEQAGDIEGVVTSTPRGIDCGTRIVDGVPLPQFCSALFSAGEVVTLRADAGSGTFLRWGQACDDGTGLGDPVCMVRMDRDRTIPVIFGTRPPRVRHSLQVVVEPNGGVAIDGDQNLCRTGGGAEECERTRDAGARVSLSAVADGGYVFAAWTGDCAAYGTRPSIEVVLERDLVCGATFELTFARVISVVVTGGGRVHDDTGVIDCREGGSADDCRERYTQLETVPLTAEPDPGYVLEAWGGNCEQYGRTPRIELSTLGSHTCSAHFAPAPFDPTLTVRIRNGSLSAVVDSEPPGISCTAASGSDCSETYPGLTLVRLRARPAADFVEWEGCPEVVDVSFCDVPMDAARTVTAVFRAPSPP